MQDDNIAPIVGMLARANRTIKKGDVFHFFNNGTKYFGRVDSIENNGEVYMRTQSSELDSYGRALVTTKWYIVKKMWLLDPADLFGMLN